MPPKSKAETAKKRAAKAETPLEVAQSELMKIFALQLANVAIPRDFWPNSLVKLVAGGVLTITERAIKDGGTNVKIEPTKVA